MFGSPSSYINQKRSAASERKALRRRAAAVAQCPELFLLATVTAELAGGCELAELVSYHVFGDIDGDELVAVVYCYGVAYEIGPNHRSTRPSLYHILLATLVHGENLLLERDSDEGTFLKRTTHIAILLLLVSTFDNVLVALLLGCARLETLSVETGAATGMSSGLASFTTTHRVIVGVHDNTTVVRTTSQPA